MRDELGRRERAEVLPRSEEARIGAAFHNIFDAFNCDLKLRKFNIPRLKHAPRDTRGCEQHPGAIAGDCSRRAVTLLTFCVTQVCIA